MSTSLFEPITFRGGGRAPNRIALAPLTNGQSADDGTLTDEERRWLVRRAVGGFGIVETAASHVAEDGKGFDGQVGIWKDEHVPGLSRLGADLAEHGALGLVQLYHGGVRAPSKLTGRQPWSASAFHEDKPGFETPRAASEADLVRVIEQFRDAAVRARRAGFGGVELHGAHGYLLSQFLSVAMNQRDDDWGGTLAGRARLIREVTRAVRGAVPGPFVLGVRLSLEDFGYAHGLDLDESIQVAAWLAEDGVDFVHLSLWNAARMTKKRPDQHPVPLVRAALPRDVAIKAAGNVWTRAEAEALLGLGADIVSIGRAAIIDPDWPARVRAGELEPRRGPLTPEQYLEVDVSARFITYLRNFKNMVA